MSFQSMMDSAMGVVIGSLGEDEPVTYQRGAGTTYSIGGVFQEMHEELDPEVGGIISSDQPELLIRNSDLPLAPQRGDRVEVRGRWFTVADAQPDGNAGTLLLLHR